jgi:hypothetical protein
MSCCLLFPVIPVLPALLLLIVPGRWPLIGSGRRRSVVWMSKPLRQIGNQRAVPIKTPSPPSSPASIPHASLDGLVLASRYVVLPCRAMVDPRLSLLDLRTLGRLCALGAAYGPGGALLSLAAAAQEWAISPARLRASVAHLVALGYLRRIRSGRYTRIFANDFPPLTAAEDAGCEPMRPLRPWRGAPVPAPAPKVRVTTR